LVYDAEKLKNFVAGIRTMDEHMLMGKLDSILTSASQDSAVFCQTVSFLEKPFGDPNSAYRNEELFIELLQEKMSSPWYDSLTKAATRNKLSLLMQNRPGNVANDFTYTTPAGYKRKMHDVKADYLLLYFYNPECPACKTMKDALVASPVISNAIASGALKVLAIYSDADEKIWLTHLSAMPQNWIHGRDENEYLYKNSVYDLHAIPTVYLLDREKKVLLKDVMNVAAVEEVIRKDKKLKVKE